MKKITKFKDQKILVLGLARSGMAAALVLNELGAIVTVNDGKPFEENKEAQLLLEGVEFYSNGIRSATSGGLRTIMVPDILPANDEMHELAETILNDLNEVIEYLDKM